MDVMKPTAGLSRWIAWLCYMSVLLFGAYILADAIFAFVLYSRAHESSPHFSSATIMTVRMAAWMMPKLSVAILLDLIITAVLSFVWLHRSRANLDVLEVPGLNYSPGWCVGWWFIPVANLVMPYRVVGEIDSGSHWRKDWLSHGVPRMVTLWWVTYITYGMLLRGSQGLADHDNLMLVAVCVELVARVSGIVAALCFARVVLRVHAAQFKEPAEISPPWAEMQPDPA